MERFLANLSCFIRKLLMEIVVSVKEYLNVIFQSVFQEIVQVGNYVTINRLILWRHSSINQ